MLDLGIIAVILRLLKFYKKRLSRAIARGDVNDPINQIYLSEMDVVEELEEYLDDLKDLEVSEIVQKL